MRIPEDDAAPLRLGHIVYSNCFPVHARLLDQPADGDPTLVEGVPSSLNRLLSEGGIHAAPSSSIEYAYHADRYRLLPDLVIGSRGPVRSILFLANRPARELDGELVAIPTASATSVVLLRILLSQRWGVANIRYVWFDQATEDPFAAGAAAALFIGDVALNPGLRPDLPVRLDLGAEWWDHTGLPFAFALWQTSAPERSGELRALHDRLVESREYGMRERSDLAARYASRYRMDPSHLARYWGDLSFDLDREMIRGLEEFYRLAAAVGEIPRAPELRWIG